MDYYITFAAGIDQTYSTRLVNAIDAANALNANQPVPIVQRIVIFFSSLGGSIHEGFLIASVIQNSKVPVEIHANNNIDSIGNVIYMSGSRRTAESFAKFFMHGASSSGNFDVNAMQAELTALKTNNTRIAYFISENSNLPLTEVQKIMKRGTTITAQKALEYGMVNEISHRRVPPGALRQDTIFVN